MMALTMQIAIALFSCLVSQCEGTHYHFTFNDSEPSLFSNLLGADSLGIPHNETLRLLSTDADTASNSANGTASILSFITYPLIAIANHKVKTLRHLLMLPFRLVMAPVDAARALWRTKEAIETPVNATMLDRLRGDLNKLNATYLPNGQQ